jgi:hypothetical protein
MYVYILYIIYIYIYVCMYVCMYVYILYVYIMPLIHTYVAEVTLCETMKMLQMCSKAGQSYVDVC